MFSKTYECNTHRRRNSIIQVSDGSIYSSVGVPKSGNTADTRFFGKGEETTFVVKRPKYYDKHNQFDEKKIQQIDISLENEYRKEHEVWNLVYPENKAELFTKGGLRLVLPYLPGNTLTVSLSNNDLTRCQQLLSVAYAIQKFNKLGFKYLDFNTDNVLIEQKSKNLFHAYLIDFNRVSTVNDWGGNLELYILNILVSKYDLRQHYSSIDALIDGLIAEINTIENRQFLTFSTLPEIDLSHSFSL
jgi:hypothetical protein